MEEAWKLSIFVRAEGKEEEDGCFYFFSRGWGLFREKGKVKGGEKKGDDIWKSARSTLKVRKNTIFFIEKYISSCEICV